jgi:hypothetical protein
MSWHDSKKDEKDGWATAEDRPLMLLPAVPEDFVPEEVLEPNVFQKIKIAVSEMFTPLNPADNKIETFDDVRAIHQVKSEGYEIEVLQKGQEFRATVSFHGDTRTFSCYGDSLASVLGVSQTFGQQNVTQFNLNSRAPGDEVSNQNPSMGVK